MAAMVAIKITILYSRPAFVESVLFNQHQTQKWGHLTQFCDGFFVFIWLKIRMILSEIENIKCGHENQSN